MPTIIELRRRPPHEEPVAGLWNRAARGESRSERRGGLKPLHLAVKLPTKGMALINCSSPTTGTPHYLSKEGEEHRMNTNAHVRIAILAEAKRTSDRTLHQEHWATTVTQTTRA